MKPLRTIKLRQFWLVISLVYILTVVLSEFKGVPVSDFYSLCTTGSHFAIVAMCTAGLLLLLSSHKLLFAVSFPLLTLICGVMVFFNLTIGTRLTPVAIELALINDASMWWSMISPGLVAAGLFSIAVGVFAAVYRWKWTSASPKTEIIFFVSGLLIVLLPTVIVAKFKAPVGSRLPYSVYYATTDYFANKHTIEENRTTYNGVPATAAADSPDVVLILGESLRADHVPMNGYDRNTMPNLAKYDNLISFCNIYSEYTYTDRSVPHIMTAADSINPDPAYSEQSLISVFKNAGYSTVWVANQDLSRSYTYFAHEADSLIFGNAGRSLYSYEKWLDNDLLPDIKKWLDGNADKPKLTVIHSIGSHWWYRSHYNEEHALFKPEITHKDVGGLSAEEMINSYDNTIIATDEFINEVYRMIADKNAIILYVSDHGEGLGEEGVFLHGSDSTPLHWPACFVIYTPKYEELHPQKISSMRAAAKNYNTTDAIFHTAIDIANISTPAVDKTKTLFHVK